MTDETFVLQRTDTDLDEWLLAASQHDITAMKVCLQKGIDVNDQDGETGYTALHSCIAALSPEPDSPSPTGTEIEKANTVLQFLFENGAIWNDLDAADETPGCMALRLGLMSSYEIMVEAGVRAEVLLNRLDDFEPLHDDEDDEEADHLSLKCLQDTENASEVPTTSLAADMSESRRLNLEGVDPKASREAGIVSSTSTDLKDLTNDRYLGGSLKFEKGKILDDEANGVMMEWEANIMKQTAKELLPCTRLKALNIGHGMGLIDGYIQDHMPAEHHIIEAHPAILETLKGPGGWLENYRQRSADTKIVLYEGRWQDVLPTLLQEGVQFDAIYFDTFAEDYRAFRHFFEDFVIALLEAKGRMSFFNGMGADRQICYDVYTRIVEMDLFDAGLEVSWRQIAVPELENDWQGVRRRYWALRNYRLPTCTFSTP